MLASETSGLRLSSGPFSLGESASLDGVAIPCSSCEASQSSAKPNMHFGQNRPGLPKGSALPHSRQMAGEVMAIYYKRSCGKTLLVRVSKFNSARDRQREKEAEIRALETVPLAYLGGCICHVLRTDIRCLISSPTSASEDTVSATFLRNNTPKRWRKR
jgi:hypothetical protein